jgi:hypothetical protein
MTVPVVATIVDIPRSVRVAAGLILVYGVLVVANALIVGQMLGFTVIESIYPRPLIRLLGTGLMASGLVRGARWAWWLAVLLGGLWVVLGVLGIVALLLTDGATLPPSTRVVVPASAVVLGLAIVLLLRTRAAFGAKAA